MTENYHIAAMHILPLPLNDNPGIYTIRFTDHITGEVQEAKCSAE